MQFRDHFKIQSSNLGITHHGVDLFDKPSVDSLFQEIKPRGLIHLAWEARPGIYLNSLNNLAWLETSLVLLACFHRIKGKRIIVAGSCAEYSWETRDALNESTSPKIPDSIYGATKNSLRLVLEKWAEQTGISWAWPRFFSLYGPGEHPTKLIPKIINKINNRENFRFDSGREIRDFLHVVDAAEAIVKLFESDLEGPINIASGQGTSLHDLIHLIEATIGRKGLVSFNPNLDSPNQPHRIVACTSKLKNELDWIPQRTLLTGIKETCNLWGNSVY